MKNLLKEDISKIRRVMGLNEALGAPIETLNVSSEFNKQRKGYKHHGVDLSTPSGTNVVAIDGGTVIDAEIRNDNCGGTLYIEHAGGFKSRFCHLKQINVKKGDKVEKGQIVALSGGGKGEKGAGRSSGSHLHFELYKDGSLVDPIKYVNKADYNPLETSTGAVSGETKPTDYIGTQGEDFGKISQIFKDIGIWKESINESEVQIQPGYVHSMVSGRVVEENMTSDQCVDSVTLKFKYGNELMYLNYCSIENPIVKVGDVIKKGDRIGYSKDPVYAYFFDEKGSPVNFPQGKTGETFSKDEKKTMRSLDDSGTSPWLKDGPYYGNLGDVLGTLSRKLNPLRSRYALVKTKDPVTNREVEKKVLVHQGGLKGLVGKGPKMDYLDRIKYSVRKPEELPKKKEPVKVVKKKKIDEDIDQIKRLLK